MNAFFYSNSNLKSIEKLIFPAFGKILVLANAFFYSNSNLKSIEKLIFAAFGKIFWFWRMLFSIQILIKKSIENLIFAAFGKIFLVLGNAFFYSNSNLKSIEKLNFFSFWQDLGFGECFFAPKFAPKSRFAIVFVWFGP